MAVSTLLLQQVAFAAVVAAHAWEPSVPAACAIAPWVTTVPIRLTRIVVLQPRPPVVLQLLTRRATPPVAVALEVVASAAAVPVLQAEAVASVVAVEAVLLVAMQVDADNMNSEQLIVNSEK